MNFHEYEVDRKLIDIFPSLEYMNIQPFLFEKLPKRLRVSIAGYRVNS